MWGVEVEKSVTQMLKELREDNDKKQKEVAAVLGTTQQHYSKYETGEYEIPLRALLALADYYQVSTDYITGRTSCKQGVDGLNRALLPDYTCGDLVSDALSLNDNGRKTLVEFVAFAKSKDGK